MKGVAVLFASGQANLHEFAVGSDPTIVDDPPGLRVIGGADPVFQIDLDADSMDGIECILEVSSDLENWRAVDESSVRVELSGSTIKWFLDGGVPTLFGRVRFREAPDDP